MPNRLEQILRAAACGLAIVLAVQLVMLAVRRNPLAGLEVPVPPRWSPSADGASTNTTDKSPIGATHPEAGRTNRVIGTNVAVGTNLVVLSNTVIANSFNSPTNLSSTTNALAGTNLIVVTNQTTVTNVGLGTNQLAGTNVTGATNAIAGTNAVAAARPPRPPGSPGGPPSRKPPRPAPPLPPLTQARIDRITSSEMLAPVFRPPPMALLGIAGHHAFIRTPNGQSALLREGGESDGIKLLRLGTNRVLIEQAGEKKELTIFNGFGSESLLNK